MSNKARPMVAVVGRPNVGKSTFFNHIAGRRIAIVEDTPGVTRDRIYADVEWLGHPFTLVDTGGIEPETSDSILIQMRNQAELAVDMASVILFFVDAREGLTPADSDVAQMLRRSRKPVILVANKVDHFPNPEAYFDFYELGMGEPVPISSANKLGIGDLLDEIVRHLPTRRELEEEEDRRTHIVVVGRPNVGKSSTVNGLLREERVIVHDEPGTTRDAIDTQLRVDGEEYVLVDTAGLRKKSRIADASIERYSAVRSLAAVRRADVVLLIIDATTGIAEQESKIAGYAHELGKAFVILVNKWDAVQKTNTTTEQFKKKIRAELSFMDYAPILFYSALTGQRIHKIIELVKQVMQQATRRIPTGVLNDVIQDALTSHEPPYQSGRRPKLYYATQVSIKPPTFVFFVNEAQLFHFSYMRYLENHLRKSFGFEGTPIQLILRERKKED
ncbi:MAG: ribosome biogenesis GTPase Der [Christensenellales bacterium]|jgi:GTP-binding protein